MSKHEVNGRYEIKHPSKVVSQVPSLRDDAVVTTITYEDGAILEFVVRNGQTEVNCNRELTLDEKTRTLRIVNPGHN